MGYGYKFDKYEEDEEYGSHQTRSPKKKEKKRDDFDTFGGPTTNNKKCKNCIHKNECDQTNAAKCKRFAKGGGRKGYDDDYDY